MSLELLDEKGFIFLDMTGKPFQCRMWGDSPWLMYWRENHFISLRQVTQTEIWQFPRNLTEQQQQVYRDLQAAWEDNLRPHIPALNWIEENWPETPD